MTLPGETIIQNSTSVLQGDTFDRTAAQRRYGNIKTEYGGVFTGKIESIDVTNGTAVIAPFGISPNGQRTINAKITKLAGGENAVAGIMAVPSVGATCVCAFEHAQGGQNTAFILSYTDSKQVGTASLQPGDMLMATNRGLKLSLDNEKNVVQLLDGNQFGYSVINNLISISSKSLKINNYDTNATEISFNNNAASIVYETVLNSMKLESKNFLHIVGKDYKTSVTGNRDDVTIGEHHIKAGNLTNNATHQLTLIGSEKITLSSTGDYDTTADAIFSTATKNIIRGSLTGNIVDYAQVGTITLAAGTASTTGTADSAGITAAASRLDLATTGKITLKNNLSSTTHNPAGFITTDTVNYELNAKLQTNINAKVLVALDSKLAMTLDSVATMALTSKATMTLDSSLAMTLSSKLSLNLNSLAMMNLKSSALINMEAIMLTMTAQLPLIGMSTITIFGPQPMIPV